MMYGHLWGGFLFITASILVGSWRSISHFPVRFQQFHLKCQKTESGPLTEASILKLSANRWTSKAILPLFLTILSGSKADAKVAKEDDFIDNLASLMVAKEVMAPTKKYVEAQAYDSARSNIKYILNDLQLQKQVTSLIQNSIDFCDDYDAIEVAQEAGNRVANTAIQYDSTVYTCVFIPSDDGTVPPNAEKYRNQAFNFYSAFNQDIDSLLKLGNEDQMGKARSKAALRVKGLPPVLFKDNVRPTGI